MQLAVGALYRKQSMNYTVTPDAVLNLATGKCQILQEGCGSPGRGSENVKELYAESLIPLLADQPWAKSLNLDLGVRTSRYSTSGTTTNGKIAIEWKPVADLLVRGTVSQVFRAPNLDELYDGVTLIQPNLNDPCVGLTAAQLAQHAAACQSVPVGWVNTNAQVNTYYSGASTAGTSLKTGKRQVHRFRPGLRPRLDAGPVRQRRFLAHLPRQPADADLRIHGGPIPASPTTAALIAR
jgi:Outer membrane cobalamin receptor protein